ncbi:MAG TPA: hypothetical protein PK794_09050, partial [Armatimonadota bacterium]|nr:hypothetical protein [Armatimonadota bacterium]
MPYLVLCVLLLCCATAFAGPRTETITDYLGLDWRDELVHYDLTFAPGELKGAAQVGVTAGKTALPSQTSDVTRHPDGSVASCRVWFVATVPANGSVTYTFTPGKGGVKGGETLGTRLPEAILL